MYVEKATKKSYGGNEYCDCQIKNSKDDKYYTQVNSKKGVEVPEGEVELEFDYRYNKWKKRPVLQITSATSL